MEKSPLHYWSGEKGPTTFEGSEEVYCYICGQWRSTFLNQRSVEKDPITLVVSIEGPPYICINGEGPLLC